MLVGLADVDRYPFAVGMKLRPAMVAADGAGVFVGRNGETDGKPRGDVDGAAEGDEVGVKIGAVARARIAGVERIAAAPAFAGFAVAHMIEHVPVESLRAGVIILRLHLGSGSAGDGDETRVQRYQPFGAQMYLGITGFTMGALFLAGDLIAQGDAFTLIGRPGLKHENVVAARGILHPIPGDRRLDGEHFKFLMSIGLGQGNP